LVTWVLCSDVKWLGHETDHTPPSSATVKNETSYTFIPHMHSRQVQELLPLPYTLIETEVTELLQGYIKTKNYPQTISGSLCISVIWLLCSEKQIL
jgi:hypothetical protein